MKKSDLIQLIVERFNLPLKDSEKLVELFFDSLVQELKQGGRVEIRGFGNFVVRSYQGYTGRNPKTGKKVKVPEKRLPFWKTGKELNDRLNTE